MSSPPWLDAIKARWERGTFYHSDHDVLALVETLAGALVRAQGFIEEAGGEKTGTGDCVRAALAAYREGPR